MEARPDISQSVRGVWPQFVRALTEMEDSVTLVFILLKKKEKKKKSSREKRVKKWWAAPVNTCPSTPPPPLRVSVGTTRTLTTVISMFIDVYNVSTFTFCFWVCGIAFTSKPSYNNSCKTVHVVTRALNFAAYYCFYIVIILSLTCKRWDGISAVGRADPSDLAS